MMLLYLQTPSSKLLFLFPSKTLNPNKPRSPRPLHLHSLPLFNQISFLHQRRLLRRIPSRRNVPTKLRLLEARRKNWIERGWAPGEEILSPEADFARKSLDEGEEVTLKSPEAIEAFRMLRPNYRKKKMEELGMSDDEFYEKQFEIKGEKPEELRSVWDGPVVVTCEACCA